jgi:hypothetical protein
MANPSHRSTTISIFPVLMSLLHRTSMASRGAVPNRSYLVGMPWFIGKRSHESLGGDEESGVDLQCCRVLAQSGLGGRLPNELFVHGIDEDDEEAFSGMFHSWLKPL